MSFPRIQGADATGRIAAVGDSVDPGRIGERVLIDPWVYQSRDWFNVANAWYYGSECDGGFADYAIAPADQWVAIDCDLSDAELATFPCAITTAENLIRRTGLQPGETVVIAGASGGVGSAAVQLARLRGAKVVGIAAAAKADLMRELGCEAVVDRHAENLEAAIREACGGAPDVALDVVGGDTFIALIDALKYGGRYSSSGVIGQPMVQFDVRRIAYKDLQMTGATLVPPGTMPRLCRMIERGQIKPLLAQTFPLKDLAMAQEAFAAKKHVGNIVVTMD